ncbi:MAG: MarR family winged helix-turn-helix transcriptional regulator [Bulleidia sp.]
MEEEKRCPMKDDPQRHLMHALRMCGDFLSYRRGQRPGQNRVLFQLHRYGSITQKQLQEILQIQQGSLSELLSKMESSGLIERTRNPEDRRQVVLSLTEKGKEIEHANHEQVMEEHKKLFSSLSEAEQKELYRMLRTLLADWKEKNPEAFPEEKRGMRR